MNLQILMTKNWLPIWCSIHTGYLSPV